MHDLVIRDAVLVDGTGTKRRPADVAVRDGRIADIADAATIGVATTRRVVNADGLVLAPGFIDVHTHYDAQICFDGACTPSPFHGVTTVLAGNCGFSVAPLAPEDADYLISMLARVEGMPVSTLTSGLTWGWRSTDEYLRRLPGTIAVNAGFLVGHTAIRLAVMGERS